MTLYSRVWAGTLAASLSFGAGAAQAALIFDETITPQSSSNSTTFFDDDNDFNESFDFSALDIVSVDRFELTLESAGFRDERLRPCLPIVGCFTLARERWDVRAQGSDAGASTDDDFERIASGVQTFTYDVSSDGDVFAHSVASEVFTFWLSERSSDALIANPSITISSANLKIFGEVAPIPVPAALPLLALGLGGLGLAARRQRRTRAA